MTAGAWGNSDASGDSMPDDRPLSDLRVLEIGYGIAAPMTCRTLAEFGADVIRIESTRRPDSLRTIGAGWVPLDAPWEIRRDTSIGLEFTSSDKRSLGLEIDGPAGYEVFLQLIAKTDVLVMNMAVEAVEKLRLTYEDLRAANPGLIHLNLSSFGSSDGPYRNFRTWGANLSGLAGLTELTGWPDRDPVGVPLSFPDYPSALWGAIGVLCAVMRRDVTGQGCAIDISQFQVAISTIGPSVAEAVLRGQSPPANGNRRAGWAPHGVYPTREDDRFVAISVRDEEMFGALATADGLGSLGADVRFTTLADRVEHQDELDTIIGDWTRRRTAWEVAFELQRLGVAAVPVMDHWEVLGDPQLAARRYFRVLPSRRFGGELTYGAAVVLSDTPASYEHAAPAFAEHSRQVLAEVAGLSDEEIDDLVARHVVYEMPDPDLHLERPFLNWIPRLMRLDWPPAEVDPAAIVFERFAAPTDDD